MSLFEHGERDFAAAISQLAFANPFLPERIEAEKRALGGDFKEAGADWNIHAGSDREAPNFDRLLTRTAPFADTIRDRLRQGTRGTRDELVLYEDVVLFHLYHAFRNEILTVFMEPGGRGGRAQLYKRFADDFARYLHVPGIEFPSQHKPAHAFAISFNVRRAFEQIFYHIIGTSPVASRLRADVWQSIFTHELRRYYRVMFERMTDITCLVTGPSGTGKDLVARAIGLSRYMPFDEATNSFPQAENSCFYPLNLSALSTTLIESELFGHRRGSFTGATEDHAGWFEVCGPFGTVFLDEIGETDMGIQVKLLRVLQNRNFQPLGDTRSLRFEGKVIAATNRDLAQQMREGRFREDLYYRLCSDIIVTRPLHEQVAGSSEELHRLVLFIAQREVGDEAPGLVKEVMEVIEHQLGLDYPWPGNFRELEQCVRNVLVRCDYRPAATPRRGARERLSGQLLGGALTADELIRGYSTLVYAQTGNYEETARRLNLDRRTVKSRIDEELLAELRADGTWGGATS